MNRKPLNNRFNLHQITRDAINRAVALRIVDAVSVACMAIEFGADDAAWLNDLCETAFVGRMSGGVDVHAEMCKFNDAFHCVNAGKR